MTASTPAIEIHAYPMTDALWIVPLHTLTHTRNDSFKYLLTFLVY